jgi:Icc protein
MGYTECMANQTHRMHIAWLSDVHIGAPGELPHGIDVRDNFIRALEDIERFETDVLVLGGDLCLWEGDGVSYRWIAEELARISPAPLIWTIPGNHDEPSMMREVRSPADLGGELPRRELLATPAGPAECLLLDSSSGTLDGNQLSWLAARIAEPANPALPRLVFMHHPPAHAGVPYMDQNYPLSNRDEVLAVLSANTGPVWVFAGHYHCDVQTAVGNVTVFACPSTYTPIRPQENRHVADTMPPGWRLIRIDERGIHSYPRYLL